MSVKNLVAGEGYWTYVKEILGWILDMQAGKITPLDRNIEKLLTLLDIPAN